MKIIYSYISKRFIKVFLIILIVSISLFYVIDFFNNLSTLISHKVKFLTIIYYYAAYTPKIIYMLLPFAFSLSVLITLGYLAHTNEILAMKNSGISTIKIASPIHTIALILVFLMLFLDNFLVPYAYNKALLIREMYIENAYENLWAKKDNVFVRINLLFYKQKLAYDTYGYIVDNNEIKKVIFSKIGRFNRLGLSLENSTVISINNNGIKVIKTKKTELKNFNLLDFVKDIEYQTPNILELYKKSLNSKHYRYLYEAMIVFKIIYALSLVAMLPSLLYMSLNVSPRKDDFVRKVFLGMIYTLVFLGLLMLFNAMAQSKIINPVFPISTITIIWFLYFLKKLLEN